MSIKTLYKKLTNKIKDIEIDVKVSAFDLRFKDAHLFHYEFKDLIVYDQNTNSFYVPNHPRLNHYGTFKQTVIKYQH